MTSPFFESVPPATVLTHDQEGQGVGVERTPNPTLTRQVISVQNSTRDTCPDWAQRSWHQGWLPAVFPKYIVQFTLCAEKFLKIAARSIAWLPIAFFGQISLKIIKSFANPHQVNPTRSWLQLSYLTGHGFSLLVPPLPRRCIQEAQILAFVKAEDWKKLNIMWRHKILIKPILWGMQISS